MTVKHWLMKAEPNSRIEKGKDVKFSVDDFESVKTTPWEGVRNAEARNLMKEMKVGDKVLFYHSNCKNPGIAAFAEVSKEAYPDYTAWDPEHPYYDQKTDKENPKWYMVEVTFVARATHFVPLSLLRRIAASSPSEIPSEIGYIGEAGVKAIKEMALVTRGRLSVQRVEEKTWGIIKELAEKGGWDESESAAPKRAAKGTSKAEPKSSGATKSRGKVGRRAKKDEDEQEDAPSSTEEVDSGARGRKRKANDGEKAEAEPVGVRRSTRHKKS